MPSDRLRSDQLSEGRVTHSQKVAARVRQRERRGITQVKRLGPELQHGFFGHAEFLEHRHVEVPRSGAAEREAGRIAERDDRGAAEVGDGRWNRERCGIEVLIEARVLHQGGLSRDAVRAVRGGEHRRRERHALTRAGSACT